MHMSNNSSLLKSRNAPPLAVNMTRRNPPGGTPCKHWNIAECSESAGSMLIPCFSTNGLMTGPPLINVSLLAKAISLPSLIASIVGNRPAAPTIPVTTVSADDTVAASTIPSGPCTICGMFVQPISFNIFFNWEAASGVLNDATFGEYFITCSAINWALFPALNASTIKFCGHASTMSSVCVPMLPVEPKMDIRFWNVEPLKHSSSVFCSDAAELTGEDGSIHPSPVPNDPGVEKIELCRLVFVLVVQQLLLRMEGVKEDTSLLPRMRKPHRARDGSFMVGCWVMGLCNLQFRGRGEEKYVTFIPVVTLKKSK